MTTCLKNLRNVCAVRGCTKSVCTTGHVFPKNDILGFQWIEATDNPLLLGLRYSQLRTLKICKDHFKQQEEYGIECDYVLNGSRSYLNANAVPTLKLPEKTIPIEKDINLTNNVVDASEFQIDINERIQNEEFDESSFTFPPETVPKRNYLRPINITRLMDNDQKITNNTPEDEQISNVETTASQIEDNLPLIVIPDDKEATPPQIEDTLPLIVIPDETIKRLAEERRKKKMKNKIPIIREIKKICRTCMNEYDENHMLSLFSTFDINGQQISQMIMSFTCVQISADDGKPQQVCMNCVQEIAKVYFFKEMCEKSDKNLSNALPSRNTSPIELSQEDNFNNKYIKMNNVNLSKRKMTSDKNTDKQYLVNNPNVEYLITDGDVSNSDVLDVISERLYLKKRNMQNRRRLYKLHSKNFKMYKHKKDKTIYKCKKCPKVFALAKSLHKHKQTHLDEKQNNEEMDSQKEGSQNELESSQNGIETNSNSIQNGIEVIYNSHQNEIESISCSNDHISNSETSSLFINDPLSIDEESVLLKIEIEEPVLMDTLLDKS